MPTSTSAHFKTRIWGDLTWKSDSSRNPALHHPWQIHGTNCIFPYIDPIKINGIHGSVNILTSSHGSMMSLDDWVAPAWKGNGRRSLGSKVFLTRWWFHIFFYFHPEIWGRWTHFDEHIFQTGWFNHQPDEPGSINSLCWVWEKSHL